jgi:2-dehydro-3-deoxygalactonokinase
VTSPHVIVVDWGTSSFRAYLVELESGHCFEEIADGLGMSALARTEFPSYCREQTARWRPPGTSVPIYMAGMVGAAQGWLTAPQPPLPVDAGALALRVVPAEGLENAWILPGVRCHGSDGHVDVMRGEEVQIFGALEEVGADSAHLCLPGTHSKWATVRDGTLMRFATAMTGELYQVILRHTVVGRLGDAEAAFDPRAFERGLSLAGRPGGLPHHVFGARGRFLYGDLGAAEIPSYLSGLLIGEELVRMAELEPLPPSVLLVCSERLRGPYEAALAFKGVNATWIAARIATLRGVVSVIRHHAARRGAHQTAAVEQQGVEG